MLYVIFLGLFIGFRKYFTKDLVKNNSKKIKSYIVIIYSAFAIIGTMVLTVFLFTKNIPMPRMAMLYIAIFMGEICLIYISNDYIKNIIVFTFTLALIMVVTVDINNYIDEARHFASAYNVAIRTL